MFVDRHEELAFLSSVLERDHPTRAQLILLYGRRRVGKTVLLRHWAENSGLPHTYWAAEKEPAPLQRRKLFARVLGVEPGQAATFDSWADCWAAITALLAGRRHILILDEFTYAAESDPAMLSSLQHAWDQHFTVPSERSIFPLLLPFHRSVPGRTGLPTGSCAAGHPRGPERLCRSDGL